MKVKEDRDLLNFLLPKNREVGNIDKYIYPVSKFGKSTSGVFLIPTFGDSLLLRKLHWDESVDVFLRDELFPTFQKIHKLDYLFIDGRTGFSRFSGFALKQADLVLIFCRLDKQNQDGIERMVRVCHGASKPFLIVVSGCPTRVGYKEKITYFEKKVKSKVDCILPYMGDLYFDESIVCQDKPNCPLGRAYQKLAEKILSKGITL